MRDHTLARECPSDLKTKVADVSLENEARCPKCNDYCCGGQDEWRQTAPYANVLSFLKNWQIVFRKIATHSPR